MAAMRNGSNLYGVLGVATTTSMAEIRKAYKKLALIHHPDKGGDEKTFKEIVNAYEILSDAKLRKEYDDGLGHTQDQDSEAETEIIDEDEDEDMDDAYEEDSNPGLTDDEGSASEYDDGEDGDVDVDGDDYYDYGDLEEDGGRYAVLLKDGTYADEAKHEVDDPEHLTCVLDDSGDHLLKEEPVVLEVVE